MQLSSKNIRLITRSSYNFIFTIGGDDLTLFAYDREDTISIFGTEHPLFQNTRNGLRRDELSHYTSIEALEYIVSTRYWKFTRIDKSNDLLEAKYIAGEDKPENEKFLNLLYAASFVHESENAAENRNGTIPMWLIYTQQDQGVKLKLKRKNKELPIATQLFDVSRNSKFYFKAADDTLPQQNNQAAKNCSIVLAQSDILYDDSDKVKDISTPRLWSADRLNFSIAGLYKNRDWAYENETRIITKFSITGECHLSEADYLLIPIKFDMLSLEVMFNPWMGHDEKEKIKNICKVYLTGVDYSCVNCGLEGAVKRKN